MTIHEPAADPAAVEPFMTAEAVFDLLGIDRSTGYRAIRQGQFPVQVVRVGRLIRIPTAAVRRLIAAGDTTATAADVDTIEHTGTATVEYLDPRSLRLGPSGPPSPPHAA